MVGPQGPRMGLRGPVPFFGTRASYEAKVDPTWVGAYPKGILVRNEGNLGALESRVTIWGSRATLAIVLALEVGHLKSNDFDLSIRKENLKFVLCDTITQLRLLFKCKNNANFSQKRDIHNKNM